jgi:alpha-L-fucosidase
MKLTRREFVAMAAVAGMTKAAWPQSTQPFAPELDSLATYKAPVWFRDAKLGIWNCWGSESVPEQGDWYARHIYEQGSPQNKFHVATYGHPSKFGYKDMVPLWKGENWQPDRLMQLYKKTGAKYFFAIAQHHDNIDTSNSKFHPWNSVKMGPRRDVIGEWAVVVRKHGLRYGVSEHLGASWNWFGVSHRSDTTGPLAGVPYDGANPEFASLYHTGDKDSGWGSWYRNAPESSLACTGIVLPISGSTCCSASWRLSVRPN